MIWGRVLQGRDRQQGLRLAGEGKFAEAGPRLERALERNPGDVEVIQALVLGKIKGGALLTEVQPLLTRWCDLQPGEALAYKLRMDLWQRLAQPEAALADGERALELDPGDDAVRREVAGLLFTAGRYDEAERACRECLDRLPAERPALLCLLARTLLARGKNSEAGAVPAPLLRERPDYAEALLIGGLVDIEAGRFEEAIPRLRRVREREPRFRQEASYHLGLALARTGRADEAARLMAEVQQLQTAERLRKDSNQQPDNLDLRVRAAGALLAVDRAEEARGLLESVLARDPVNPAAHRALADCYEKQGQTERAAEHRRRAGLPQ
jgi:tetratricopeptide (TPR) repeat protein